MMYYIGSPAILAFVSLMMALGIASGTDFHQQLENVLVTHLSPVFKGVNARDVVNGNFHFRELQGDVNQTCQFLELAFSPANSLAECTCGETGDSAAIELSCIDACNLCDESLDICGTQSFLIRLESSNQSGISQPAYIQSSVTYARSRNDLLFSNILVDIDSGEAISCSVGVNDQTCSECRVSSNCTDGSYYYDCSNIEANAVFDQCAEGTSNVPVSSVFIGLNENYFDFNECINSTVAPATASSTPQPSFTHSPVSIPSLSPSPVELNTMTPAPVVGKTSTPTLQPSSSSSSTAMPAVTPTSSATDSPAATPGRQPQIDLLSFQVVGSAADLNRDQLTNTLGTYLYETMLNFQGLNTLQEVRLVASTKNPSRKLIKNGHRSLQNDTFIIEYTGKAYFVLGGSSSPSQTIVHSAQVAALDNVDALQGYIDFDNAIGTDVKVTEVDVEGSKTPAPTPSADNSGTHVLLGGNAILIVSFIVLYGFCI